MGPFSGKQKIAFCRHLGKDWQALADYFYIRDAARNQFLPGEEARSIWAWLEDRGKLDELPEALKYIERDDIVVRFLSGDEEDHLAEKPKTYTQSPFPGLRAFTEDEAAIFYGRDREIHALLEKLRNSRFLAVIGASGSGKSSLVRAGVLPKLAEIGGQARWEWLRFTPGGIGDDPFLALSAALAPSLEKAKLTPREAADQLRTRGNIDEMAEKFLAIKPPTKQLVVFIDQFEELFTLTADCHRQRFINLLEKATQSSRLRIILTVRADFHEQCLGYPTLAGLINVGAWHLATPDWTALWTMVHGPAKAAGLTFDAGLAEQILRDTGTGSGALALMAFALEQLYLVCQPATTLTWDAYNGFGGVSKAIGSHAQETYERLDTEAQHALGEVFTDLVTVDPERGTPTRKRAALSRIANSEPAQRLIDAFTDARLLVKERVSATTSSPSPPAPNLVVEVAHEALLSHWPLLEAWIKHRFDDFCLLRQVRAEAAEWERGGRPEANLWPHERLLKVYEMQQRLRPSLSASESDFVRLEADRLLEKLEDPDLSHQQRERIGARLAEIGDPRPGIGVDANGLPKFVWCPVPAGRIFLEDDAGRFDVKPFHISRYPVTYRQYRSFLKADDGYRHERWWQDLHQEDAPGEQFHKIDNHPAENVSWYEATAFCRWLTANLGFEIRLPTEWEWQQAATGGNRKNNYPWGEKFESLRCNSSESGLGRTTAVGLYANGKSPIGALDMSGNVWEWCSNCFGEAGNKDVATDNPRVVLGAAWSSVVRSADYRGYDYPRYRMPDLGFRVVSSSPS
ncbi:MAG: SUMF1/EgtB/PvdO family nonheme iron enzyme [Pseudomonadota bacterium]